MAESQHTYTLYSYFRSSCSARVRIAAQLKKIPLVYRYIHLVQGDQHSGSYTQLNPSESVPTLVVTDVRTGQVVAHIRQSIAILEYLEESLPDAPRLLPGVADLGARARVRELVNIVACDIQPVTNLRVLNYIKPRGIEAKDWQVHFMTLGFRAYEALAQAYAGRYSVGDDLTLADCVLAPAVDGALRFGVDLQTQCHTVWRIWETIKALDAFQQARWDNQEDTPAELKSTGS